MERFFLFLTGVALRHAQVWCVGSMLCASIALSNLACARHVQLGPLPSPDAPLNERADAYGQLHAVDAEGFTTTIFGRTGTSTWESLQLYDGTFVEEPEDLLAVIGPGCSMRPAVVKAQKASNLLRTTKNVMIGVSSATLVWAGLRFPGIVAPDTDISTAEGTVFIGAFISSILVAGIGMLVGSVRFESAINDAYPKYNGCLLNELGLKVRQDGSVSNISKAGESQ